MKHRRGVQRMKEMFLMLLYVCISYRLSHLHVYIYILYQQRRIEKEKQYTK